LKEKPREKVMEVEEVVLIFLMFHCGVGRTGNVHDYESSDARNDVGGTLSGRTLRATLQGMETF
jgi:acetylornithine/succinyldiaminopimelate/putrescine aminotransferase